MKALKERKTKQLLAKALAFSMLLTRMSGSFSNISVYADELSMTEENAGVTVSGNGKKVTLNISGTELREAVETAIYENRLPDLAELRAVSGNRQTEEAWRELLSAGTVYSVPLLSEEIQSALSADEVELRFYVQKDTAEKTEKARKELLFYGENTELSGLLSEFADIRVSALDNAFSADIEADVDYVLSGGEKVTVLFLNRSSEKRSFTLSVNEEKVVKNLSVASAEAGMKSVLNSIKKGVLSGDVASASDLVETEESTEAAAAEENIEVVAAECSTARYLQFTLAELTAENVQLAKVNNAIALASEIEGVSLAPFTDRTNENDFAKVDWTRDFVKLSSAVTVDGQKSNLYYFENRLTEEDLSKLGGKNNIKLEYHSVDDDSESFTGGDASKDNDVTGYKADRALGIAGNFHIVAFDTATLGSHTNGNVLAKNLNAKSNFGTNRLDMESTYVYGAYQNIADTSASKNSHVLALGKDIQLNLQDNGNAFGIKAQDANNYTKIGTPWTIYRDSNSESFIDIDDVKQEIGTISEELAMHTKDSGYTYELKNDAVYTISDPDGIAYINLTPQQVTNMTSGASSGTVFFDGFVSGHMGSIIINVDMENTTTTESSPLALPMSARIKIDGVQQGVNEVTEFSAGKIIWNFVNAEDQYIKAGIMSGTIIALGASVVLPQNINGTIIAENVSNSGETHRTDFTGIIRPAATSFQASKTVDDEVPTAEQRFCFDLHELTDGKWEKVGDSVQNGTVVTDENGEPEEDEDGNTQYRDLETVQFQEITYGEADIGTHWYRITENQEQESGLNLDKSQYLVKVVVTENEDATYTATETYYKVIDTDSLLSEGEINEDALESVESDAEFKFNNTTPIATMSVIVKKTWDDNSNQDNYRPESITVKLLANGTEVCSAELRADNITPEDGWLTRILKTISSIFDKNDVWEYTFDNLPKYENGERIIYTVEEVDVDGYELSRVATSSNIASNSNVATNSNVVTGSDIATGSDVVREYLLYELTNSLTPEPAEPESKEPEKESETVVPEESAEPEAEDPERESETTVPKETTAAETITVLETTGSNSGNSGGSSGGGGGGDWHAVTPTPEATTAPGTEVSTIGNSREEVETNADGSVRDAGRGRNQNGDGGDVNGARRSVLTGDQAMSLLWGTGFMFCVILLFAWVRRKGRKL